MAPDARYVSVQTMVESVRPDGSSAPMTFSIQDVDLQGECVTAAATGVVTCADVPSLAARVVGQFGEHLFPPDPSVTRQRQARLLDGALEPTQRMRALEELISPLPGNRQTAVALSDPATMRGVLSLAVVASDPALRARLWRNVRGAANPDLLPALLTSAVSDADEPRLEAVATLAADFVHDSRAHATLQSVVDTDARALVRAVAGRALSGEAAWRAYVNASLHDASRPAAERVEAFVYQFNLPPSQQPQGTGLTYQAFSMIDEAGIETLAPLLLEATKEQPASERRLVQVISAMAAQYRGNTAVTDVMLHLLRHGQSTNTRVSAVQSLRLRMRDEERVRAALREAHRSDPSPEVRDLIQESMASFGASP